LGLLCRSGGPQKITGGKRAKKRTPGAAKVNERLLDSAQRAGAQEEKKKEKGRREALGVRLFMFKSTRLRRHRAVARTVPMPVVS
jgi:hypothetical protein